VGVKQFMPEQEATSARVSSHGKRYNGDMWGAFADTEGTAARNGNRGRFAWCVRRRRSPNRRQFRPTRTRRLGRATPPRQVFDGTAPKRQQPGGQRREQREYAGDQKKKMRVGGSPSANR